MIQLLFKAAKEASVILMIVLSGSASAAQNELLDIAINNGRVIDPETGLDGVRSVGIRRDKIVVISKNALTATREIDATGRIVSPGFIDMHAHGQTIIANRVQAFDGVTTALELEAGTFPVSEFYAIRQQEGRPINYGASVSWLSARIATLLGETPSSDSAWFLQMLDKQGWQNSIANHQQVQTIVSTVERGLDEGGLGVGFLTGYAPGSGHKEYYAVSQLAAMRNMPTFTHARYLSMLEPQSSFEAIQEIIAVAASTGGRAHIVHLNSISLNDIGVIKTMIANARNNGVNISTEAYPYGAGSTGIGAEMFRGPDWQTRAGGISANNFEIDGKRLSSEAFITLQQEKPGTDVIIHFLDTKKAKDQALLDESLLMKEGVIASDGGDWMVGDRLVDQHTWPLPQKAWSHPRSAGTFAKFIQHYVRDTKQLSLPEAIKKVSFLPAKILQSSVPMMSRKGRIQVGADADIVVFSLETISDTASYSHSASVSDGVEFLLVNGVPVIQQGKLDTSALPGRAVRNKQKQNSN